jgi:hypothetical protein
MSAGDAERFIARNVGQPRNGIDAFKDFFDKNMLPKQPKERECKRCGARLSDYHGGDTCGYC